MRDNKELILGIIGVLLVVGIFIISTVINKDNNIDLLTGKHYVKIEVKDYGDIFVELDADSAPITVTNFMNLVNDKFYDGLTFHRIIKGFMIQGGGYKTDGNKKLTSNIKGEFTANNVTNTIKHERGVISMARATNYDSASSEFFIMHEDNSSLDGMYAAFGHVIDGMNVVDEIANDAKPTDDNGSIELDKRPVITSIRKIEVATTDDNINYGDE